MSAANVRRSPGRIWRWPVLFAVLIVFGLSSALLGQSSFWWGLSWIALSVPLAAIARFVSLSRYSRGKE
jgi:hypothetical protein